MAKYKGRQVSIEQYPSDDPWVIVLYDGAKELVDLRDLTLSPQELGLFFNRENTKIQKTVDRQTKKRTEEELKEPKDPEDPKPPKEPKPTAQISIGVPKDKEKKDTKQKRIL